MGNFKTYSSGAGRPHLRTNSKSSAEISLLSTSSSHAHASGVEGIQLRNSPFPTMGTPSVEDDPQQHSTLPTIHEYDHSPRKPSKPSSSGLKPVHRKTTSTDRATPSSVTVILSLLHRVRLYEIIYPLVFFISLVAFLAPLSGFGYHEVETVTLSPVPLVQKHHISLNPKKSRVEISPKDIGPLFADALIKSRKSSKQRGVIRPHTFSQSASDSDLHASGLKPLIEPHDAGKPDLVKASNDDHESDPENIFEAAVKLPETDGNMESQSVLEIKPEVAVAQEIDREEKEEDHREKEEDNKEEEEKKKEEEAQQEEEDLLEEDPEISDDTETPEDFEYPTEALILRDPSSDSNIQSEGASLEPVEEAESKIEDSTDPEPESKTKELESLLQSLEPVINQHFPAPSEVEAISGRKGLRARQF